MQYKMGRYFVVTGGYCAGSGLTNKTRRALLFVSDDGIHYREPNDQELSYFQEKHPILSERE